MGNCFAKICNCYDEDPNAAHSSNYSRIDNDDYTKHSAYSSVASHESMKAHKHYQQNKYVSQSRNDNSSVHSSLSQKKLTEHMYTDSTGETKEEDREDAEAFEEDEETGGLVQEKVNTNNHKPMKICLLKRGYLSAIPEEDDLIRDSNMLSKREQFSRLFSIVNSNLNIGFIAEEKDGNKVAGGLIDEDRRQTIDRSTINLVIEEMKAIESLPIETVIDELLNILSKDQPMCNVQEGMSIPDVLPDYESICSTGLKRLLLIFVSDLKKEGFVEEYAVPAEGQIPDSQKYEEWLREALFEAKIKEASARYQEKVKEQLPKDQGQLIEEEQQIRKTISSEREKIGDSSEIILSKQLKSEEVNDNHSNSCKILLNNTSSNEENNNNNNNNSACNCIISSINNNDTNSFENDNNNKDNSNILDKSLVVTCKNNSPTAIIPPSSSLLTDYSRIFLKPVTEDNFKYFLLKSEYNLQGIDAKRMLECMVNEQWSRENNPNIDVFESLGTFHDYKLLYISYKKFPMISPRDFLYLKYNKRLSSGLFVTLQVSVQLDAYPPEKGKERAIVKLGGTLLKDAEKNMNYCNCENCENVGGGKKEKELGSTLQVINYTESNLKLTLNHKLTLKPTANEVKRYILRLQGFVKDEKLRERQQKDGGGDGGRCGNSNNKDNCDSGTNATTKLGNE